MADNNAVKEAIKAYLDKRAATDELFAVSYAKENKNLDECFQYIIGEVRKRGTQVYMTDEEVFGLAVHYYDEDNITINRTRMAVRTSTTAPAPELTEEEKAEAREAAKKRYEELCVAEEAERAAKRKKAEAERKKAEAEQKKQRMAETPTLFDFDEL